jgi:hypothetical protein
MAKHIALGLVLLAAGSMIHKAEAKNYCESSLGPG